MSSGRACQVTTIDPGVSFLRPPYDEHGQRTVVRPIDPVAAVRHDQALAARYRPSVHRNAVNVGRGRRGPRHSAGYRVRAATAVAIPVDLHHPVIARHNEIRSARMPLLLIKLPACIFTR